MKKRTFLLTSAVVLFSFLLTACFSGKLITNARVDAMADQVWNYSQSHPDGFTLDLRTMTEPTEGVCVAYAATQNCHSREKLDYVVKHAMKHNGYVGGWLDTADSSFYFDSSRIFSEDSLDAAEKFGIENEQIAIFHISDGKVIRLKEDNTQNIKEKENKEMKKTLIVYFSATGTTKAAAQKLAKEFDADLYEIVPEQLYTAADLDWRDKTSRSTIEMKDKSSRPAIKGRCENIAQYDTVWIGFPVWWYTAPTIVNTFIEAHDLSGKTLNVFATSGGSTVDGSYNDLKKAYPQYKWGESRLMN